MCGRDTAFFTWRDLHAAMGVAVATPSRDPEATYNRAPTQRGWVIASPASTAEAIEMRWGLLPPWAKDTRLAYSTINARLESVATKPAFRAAWRHRRALIPSSGYYEWMRLDDGTKQAYFIRHSTDPVMLYAGLWEVRRDEAGNALHTYSIVTRDADQTVATLHDRMPLVLPADDHATWLHGTPEDAMALAHAVPSAPLTFHRVSKVVGNVRNNSPELVTPIQA